MVGRNGRRAANLFSHRDLREAHQNARASLKDAHRWRWAQPALSARTLYGEVRSNKFSIKDELDANYSQWSEGKELPGPNDTHTEFTKEEQDKRNESSDATKVRLLADSSHGLAGDVVSVGASRARDLVASGRAELV